MQARSDYPKPATPAPSSPPREGAELLRLIAEQDLAAYEALYDRYANVVYSVIYRIVQDATTADEVLQDVFWQIWQKAAAYRGGGSVKAWIFQIARHRSIDELRRRKARPQKAPVELEDAYAVTGIHQSSAEMDAEEQLTRQQIQSALRDLPSDQRTCLELAYFEGLTQRQIAEAVEAPLGTVKSRMRLALQRLEHLLRGAGYP